MFSTSTAVRFLALALFALSTAIGAEDAGAKAGEAKSAAASAAKEKAKKPSIAELKKLVEEMSKQRDLMIKDFEELSRQMKDATEEQKKVIRERLEQQKKQFEEVTNALHKQIRDEQRKQRQNAPGKR
jgi:hypothetical protein